MNHNNINNKYKKVIILVIETEKVIVSIIEMAKSNRFGINLIVLVIVSSNRNRKVIENEVIGVSSRK